MDTFGHQLEAVLIESDWNLKKVEKLRRWQQEPVLIESDWNLK